MKPLNRAEGCLLGLAVGDAVGTAVEFLPRGSFEPLTDLVGGGQFKLKAGQWTDDTSMALCLATSLAESQTFDPTDQMRRYLRWYREGYLSATGRCFDIGTTTRQSLLAFEKTGDPFSGSSNPNKAGNGCLMRLAPVPIFFCNDISLSAQYSADSSRTTHAAAECLDASRLFGSMLVKALKGSSKEEILDGTNVSGITAPAILEIAAAGYLAKPIEQIVGNGYVVNAMEAALWCFGNTDTFRDAILAAANLGDDADTTAAICGQIAGAFYGREGIPLPWQKKILMRKEILALAKSLLNHTPFTLP